MPKIKSIFARKILNSHVEFTSEFIIELTNGSVGIGSSPKGETISIYEDREFKLTPELVIRRLQDDGLFDREITQEELDEYLNTIIPLIGRNNAFGLSLAFFQATTSGKSGFQFLAKEDEKKLFPPRLCLNILNGGKYAYTNPVLSDFSEFMLVAKNNDVEEVINEHNNIQKEIKRELNLLERTSVGSQMVHHFKIYDNRILVAWNWVFLLMSHGVLRGSNCIESLAKYPSNLELTKFRFSGNELLAEESIKLSGEEPFRW